MSTAAQRFFESMATWDESHTQGSMEYLARHPGQHAVALSELEDDLDDPHAIELWKVQHADDIAEFRIDPDQAYRWWREAHLAASARRLGIRPRRNPSKNHSGASRVAATELYKTFHRYDPKQLVEVSGLVIPKRVRRMGKAKWVTYRSGKIDPATLEKPKRAVDYIHEHDAGVTTFMTNGKPDTDVPEKFVSPDALVRLGYNLGFCFEDDHGDKVEAEGTVPLPELYCSPDGNCLLVIQGRRQVLAMMWGGALGVFGRGIDG